MGEEWTSSPLSTICNNRPHQQFGALEYNLRNLSVHFQKPFRLGRRFSAGCVSRGILHSQDGSSRGGERPHSLETSGRYQVHTLRDSIRSNSRRVNLREFSKTKTTGRVMTFSALQDVMVDTIERIQMDEGSPDPATDPMEFRRYIRSMISQEIPSLEHDMAPVEPQDS